MKRTMENCSLIRKYGEPGRDGDFCLGFGRSEADDEPCEPCKKCEWLGLNQESDVEVEE
ncbi:hypothetical protein [Eubacterium limosum]|uniref:hypothetical protein n=1 Tax=Eubacterium limosum TaxID=1736 RepID=UPI00155974CF|nr:hypothetical protein [Eubacterium limosum]